jgi:membrane fusion protein (multidrug efflux system)
VGVTHDPQGQAAALVVGSDNKVVLRTIQATRTVGDKWVVDGGLNEGEKVIVAGLQKVQPGMLVSAVESQTPATPIPAKVAAATPVAPPSAPASQSAAASKSK